MKYLKLTKSVDPKNPGDGYPYVFYNKDISTVWIYLGLRWILENGHWNMQRSWDSDGRWNYYGPPITL